MLCFLQGLAPGKVLSRFEPQQRFPTPLPVCIPFRDQDPVRTVRTLLRGPSSWTLRIRLYTDSCEEPMRTTDISQKEALRDCTQGMNLRSQAVSSSVRGLGSVRTGPRTCRIYMSRRDVGLATPTLLTVHPEQPQCASPACGPGRRRGGSGPRRDWGESPKVSAGVGSAGEPECPKREQSAPLS